MLPDTALAKTATDTVRVGRITSSAVCPRVRCGWSILSAGTSPNVSMVSVEAGKHDTTHDRD